MPFWLRKAAVWSAVRLVVPNSRIEVRFLKDSDFRSVMRAFVLLESRVIDSCKLRRDKSG